MGRPEKFTAEYYPMYVKDGRTLTVLQHKFGLAGIGFFTNLMRILCDTPHHFLHLNNEADKLYLASRIGCDDSELETYVSTLVTTHKLHNAAWEKYRIVYCPDLVESLKGLYEKRTSQPMTIGSIMLEVSGSETIPMDVVTDAETELPVSETHKLYYTKLENRRVKEAHPTLGVPINRTRYDNLCEKYGATVVDDYIERVKDWVDTKSHKVIADYAAAAANWMKRDNVQPKPVVQKVIKCRPLDSCPKCGGEIRVMADEAACLDKEKCGAFFLCTVNGWQESPW